MSIITGCYTSSWNENWSQFTGKGDQTEEYNEAVSGIKLKLFQKSLIIVFALNEYNSSVNRVL